MKQGKSTSSRGATKVEPIGHGYTPAQAADIGLQHVRVSPAPTCKAMGGQAPAMKTEAHKSGSQGRH